jgi:pimeloyl-ACP methyl ester carboxylesterase
VLTVDHVARLGEIEEPTLFLRGEQDVPVPREQQERPAASRDATLKVYPDTSHAVHWERP